ncbi:response regulator transcription factor [Parachitinimonas caeni]|uniref:Response regulator n=1 Tax=Parachitinimonas caeni TaxID=3031301 RepID=A0ABT7DW12_9NEIS|nr:response regulator [Parachitinimonas caeni]MDK2122847.1 response regulator [Parachitinimonas caeni]
MPPEHRICVVDDDEAIRDALKWLFLSRGHRVETCESAERFLEHYKQDDFSALLLDLRMEGMSGIELFQILQKRGYCPPTIFLTGHGDVPLAVSSLKLGAIDFIEKPFDDNALVDQVERCLGLDEMRRAEYLARSELEKKLGDLTPREREVMELFLLGRLNKQIADELSISMKTVEVHRARVLEKMGVKSAVELASLVRDHPDFKR